MAQLDLDTATLVAAATHTRSAAEALGGLALPASSPFAGDASLARAIERHASAWAATHRALEIELAALAGALRQAADVFDGAEQVSADKLAAVVASTSVRPHGTTPGSAPLTGTAV